MSNEGYFFPYDERRFEEEGSVGWTFFLGKEDNEYGGVVYENVSDGALVIPRNSNSPQYVTRSGDHEKC